MVLGSDRKHYRVLDMDFRERNKRQDKDKGDVGGGDEESGSSSDSEEDGWGGYASGDRDGDVEMGGA